MARSSKFAQKMEPEAGNAESGTFRRRGGWKLRSKAGKLFLAPRRRPGRFQKRKGGPCQTILFLEAAGALVFSPDGESKSGRGARAAQHEEGEVMKWMRQTKFGKWSALFLSVLMLLTALGSVDAAASAGEAGLPETLVPVGHTVGIKLFSDGILVVGLSELETAEGQAAPAKDCGLKVGDLILQADGTEVQSTEHFRSLVQAEAGRPVMLQVKRGAKLLELEADCVQGTDGVWRLGAWIRDSLAGIGTMTFYDPSTQVFGALGHGINDVDTALLMPLEAGAIMDSTVKTVKKGAAGDPGELKGSFNLAQDRGALYANTDCGVFGTMTPCAITDRAAVPVAQPGEVREGPATILSNIRGDTVEEYDIEITRICDTLSDTQNFIVKVTDPELLEATGGIVQGMSGSPVLQNGKLVGAVTHVMVDDPARGYGIYLTNMLKQAYGGGAPDLS